MRRAGRATGDLVTDGGVGWEGHVATIVDLAAVRRDLARIGGVAGEVGDGRAHRDSRDGPAGIAMQRLSPLLVRVHVGRERFGPVVAVVVVRCQLDRYNRVG